MRVTGGTSATFHFIGDAQSTLPFISVEGVKLESDDIVDVISPGSFKYDLLVGAAREDGINFTVDPDSDTCFGTASNLPVAIVGAGKKSVAVPFDLDTLAPCGGGGDPDVTVSVGDVSVGENTTAGSADFAVSLSDLSAEDISVDYVTVDGSAKAGEDFVAASGTLTFLAGQRTKTVRIDILNDTEPESSETFSLRLSNPINVRLGDATGSATILDDDNPSSCGKPVYDSATDQAVFVWQNCADGSWSIRTTGGGQAATTFVGSLTSNKPFTNVTGVSLENSDVLDTSDAGRIGFALTVTGPWQDGFDASAPADASLCFDLERPDLPVYFGPNRLTPTVPFDLETLGACATSAGDIPIVDWQSASGGVGVSGNTITYSGAPTGWLQNSVNSVPFSSLGVFDHYIVRWTVASNPAATLWVVGLGETESSRDWRDVDYGFRSSNGSLEIRESGIWRTAGGSLSVGDELSIAVSGSQLTYRLNGNVLYTRSITGNEDFYIDSSFKSGAIALGDFVIATN
jgi:hypothetical protein